MPMIPASNSKAVICCKHFLSQWFSIISQSHQSFITITIIFFFLLLSFKSWMSKNISKQLSPSKSVCQWQMAHRRFIGKFPNELVGKGSVIVLLDFCVQLFHPPYLDKKAGEVSVGFVVPYLFLYAVTEFVVAVLPPQVVNCLEVSF